ncbi:MAG: hypothetical protein ACFBSE_09585 [Prochloraceae cyanobacterium]
MTLLLVVIRILDPFCGSGTTALTIQQLYSENTLVDSVEINPFLALLAQAKIEAYTHNIKELKRVKSQIITWVNKNKYFQLQILSLSTFNNHQYFTKETIKELFLYEEAIKNISTNSQQKRFFQVGWTAILHKISYLRKDGRALRYVPNRQIQNVGDAIEEQWSMMISDLESAVLPKNKSSIYLGNAIKLGKVYNCSNNKLANLANRKYSLCFYSPPYCNSMDYTEIYKLELWGLKLVQTNEVFKNLRLSTLCSHPTLKKIPKKYELSKDEKCQKLWDYHEKLTNKNVLNLVSKRQKEFLPWLIKGYFDDMYIAIKQQYKALLPGGYLVIIVSGSRYKNIVISTDVILSSLIENIGMIVRDIWVARTHWNRIGQIENLRESVIIAQKPDL